MPIERNKAIMRWVFQSLPRESIALPRPAEFIGKEEGGGEGRERECFPVLLAPSLEAGRQVLIAFAVTVGPTSVSQVSQQWQQPAAAPSVRLA